MTTGFWAIPQELGLPRPPVSFLNEQAAALGESTRGTLLGVVRSGQVYHAKFTYTLEINVPILNNYRYSVLAITHGLVPMYPILLRSDVTNETEEIENEEKFIEALRKILSSTEMQRVVGVLLAQTRAVLPPL
jgi:hypothetical protein